MWLAPQPSEQPLGLGSVARLLRKPVRPEHSCKRRSLPGDVRQALVEKLQRCRAPFRSSILVKEVEPPVHDVADRSRTGRGGGEVLDHPAINRLEPVERGLRLADLN